MRESRFLSEQELDTIERGRSPDSVPSLVATIRQQQHELESLRLSADVARRDREELRTALIHAQAEIRRLREAQGAG
jgi:hypothetical protein